MGKSKGILFLTVLLFWGTMLSAQKQFRPVETSQAMEAFRSGNEAFNQKKLEIAISKYKKALSDFPDFVEAYDNIGLAYRYLGEPDNSELWLKKSLMIDPTGIVARERLAVLYQRQRNYKKALGQFKRIKSQHPKHPAGYFGAAKVRLATGDYEAARIDASKALEIYRRDNHKTVGEATLLLGVIHF